MHRIGIGWLGAAVALATVGCAGSAGSAGSDDPSPQGRTFVSVDVTGEPIPGGGPLTVGFDGDRISTYAGCNRGSGVVDLTGGVVVTRLAMTLMACPPPADGADRWVGAFFEARPHWTLTGDTLTLATDSTTVTLRAAATGR